MQLSNEAPLSGLTVGQLRDLIREELCNTETPASIAGCSTEGPKRLLYGIKGIENFFNVSHRTAQSYKDGILAPAVSQNGRKIVVDADLALKLFNERRAK